MSQRPAEPSFLLVVNASGRVGFDAETFSNACSRVLPLVYVTVKLVGTGRRGADVLGLFRGENGLQPKTTFLYTGNGPHRDAGHLLATALGMPVDTPIARPGSIEELRLALGDSEVHLVWAESDWNPPGFKPPPKKEFHASTSGIFDAQGVAKLGMGGYTTLQSAYAAFKVLDANSSHIGNYLVIPSTYAPPLEGGLQVGTDNFFGLPTLLPDVFLLSPVTALANLGGSPARRSYQAAPFTDQPLVTAPTESANVWRVEFVSKSNPTETLSPGSQTAYLHAEAPPAAWRWYAPPSWVSNAFFAFPASKMMRLTRITTGLTAEMLAGMRSCVTPYAQ